MNRMLQTRCPSLRILGVLIIAALLGVVSIPAAWAHEEGVHQPTPPQVSSKDLHAFASIILQGCERNAHCVMQQLSALATRASQEQVVKVMQEIMSAWEQEEFYCHPNAHHLGHFYSTCLKGM